MYINPRDNKRFNSCIIDSNHKKDDFNLCHYILCDKKSENQQYPTNCTGFLIVLLSFLSILRIASVNTDCRGQ